MHDLSTLLKNLPEEQTRARSEREEWIQKFTDKLNQTKKGKPYPPRMVAVHMSHIKTEEMYFFWQKCQSFDSFAAGWHYYCKPKK